MITVNLASAQVMEARKEALGMFGAINWNIQYRSGKVFVQLSCAYVRPHLECCVQAWSPAYEKDCWVLERAQKRTTKMVAGTNSLPYEERLKYLERFPLK